MIVGRRCWNKANNSSTSSGKTSGFKLRMGAQIFRSGFVAPALSRSDFVGYIDAVGWVDGIRCLIEWKTSSQSYPETQPRLLELDPQLVCYSWTAQRQNVCLINFVRKKEPQIQYLHARIRKRQWRTFAQTVDLLVSEMEAGHFYPRPAFATLTTNA